MKRDSVASIIAPMRPTGSIDAFNAAIQLTEERKKSSSKRINVLREEIQEKRRISIDLSQQKPQLIENTEAAKEKTSHFTLNLKREEKASSHSLHPKNSTKSPRRADVSKDGKKLNSFFAENLKKPHDKHEEERATIDDSRSHHQNMVVIKRSSSRKRNGNEKSNSNLHRPPSNMRGSLERPLQDSCLEPNNKSMNVEMMIPGPHTLAGVDDTKTRHSFFKAKKLPDRGSSSRIPEQQVQEKTKAPQIKQEGLFPQQPTAIPKKPVSIRKGSIMPNGESDRMKLEIPKSVAPSRYSSDKADALMRNAGNKVDNSVWIYPEVANNSEGDAGQRPKPFKMSYVPEPLHPSKEHAERKLLRFSFKCITNHRFGPETDLSELYFEFRNENMFNKKLEELELDDHFPTYFTIIVIRTAQMSIKDEAFRDQVGRRAFEFCFNKIGNDWTDIEKGSFREIWSTLVEGFIDVSSIMAKRTMPLIMKHEIYDNFSYIGKILDIRSEVASEIAQNVICKESNQDLRLLRIIENKSKEIETLKAAYKKEKTNVEELKRLVSTFKLKVMAMLESSNGTFDGEDECEYQSLDSLKGKMQALVESIEKMQHENLFTKTTDIYMKIANKMMDAIDQDLIKPREKVENVCTEIGNAEQQHNEDEDTPINIYNERKRFILNKAHSMVLNDQRPKKNFKSRPC